MPKVIIACDPGLITGLAVIRTSGPVRLASVEPEVLDVEPILMEMIEQVTTLEVESPDELLFVIEKFTITAKTAKNSQAPWSLEVTGIVRNLLWREFHREPVFQMPDKMSLWTSDRLHALDLWHHGTGLDHANDAIRHCLAAMWARGWRDSRVMV